MLTVVRGRRVLAIVYASYTKPELASAHSDSNSREVWWYALI